VGLPPPREGRWCTARNYGLAHTILEGCLTVCTSILPIRSRKINHLVTLARALLPSGSEPPQLPATLQPLIEDNEFDMPSLTLRQVRDMTFHTGCHDHSWYERSVPANKFRVGDLGYLPPGKGWDGFVRMRNVIEDGLVSLKTGRKERGECWCWENLQEGRQLLQGFDMFGGVKGWPVAVPPYKQIDAVVVHEEFVSVVKDAWEYLLLNGKQLALEEAGVKPEDLVLGKLPPRPGSNT
ncbi:hypothetical protein HYDPIDRAFT_97150, partial [Hydnomerulius pinastri MD-312]